LLRRAGVFLVRVGFAVVRGVAVAGAEGAVVVTTTGAFGVTTFVVTVVGAAGPARPVSANTKAPAASARAAAPRTIARDLIRASEPVAASRLDTNLPIR
jgi:hypothetical protein